MVDAIHDKSLLADDLEYEEMPQFGLKFPKKVAGCPD